MELNQGTVLQRKKRHVKISNEEIVLFLRAYIQHPTKWSDVINDIKGNIHQLSAQARDLYRNGKHKQLRDRLSSKLGQLMMKKPSSIENLEIHALVDQVIAMGLVDTARAPELVRPALPDVAPQRDEIPDRQ